MRIVFFGSGDFAVPCLQGLAAARHEIPLVVTQPDRPAGRGGGLRRTPVKETAEALCIPTFEPERLRDETAHDRLRGAAPALCAIVAYGKLVPGSLLSIPEHGFINAHASLLPKYRGAAPVPHAILAGETETGVTVFRLAETWDSGPVYGTVRTPIRPQDTSETVLERLSFLAADLLVRVVAEIDSGAAEPRPQAHEAATRAPKLTREAGRIDWADPAARIDRQVRAFQPWPEAYTTMPGKRGRTRRVHILGVEREPQRDPAARNAPPGTVIEADPKEGVVVAAGAGEALRLTRIKPEGRGAMSGAAFVRGNRVAPGLRLGEA
jgi:methionyl-tRNA formyltransferase